MKKTTMFHIPLKTVSEANNSDHWLKRSKRHAEQKWLVKKIFKDNNFKFKLPLTVTLIRLSSKLLDSHDNLPASLKYVVDQIASEITGENRPGKADDEINITWKYDQRKVKRGQYGIDIIIEEC